jgi:hypothetical protein
MRPEKWRGRDMLPRGEAWLACVAVSLCLAACDRVNGADITPGQLEAVYQRIDSNQKMTLTERYDAKMSVLKSSLEAGGAYTDAMETLQRYARIGAEPATALRPEVGKVLSDLNARVKAASDNPIFDSFGKISKGEGYVSQAVILVSDIDKIEKNTNLTPSAKRELSVLRGAAEAVLIADNLGVPVPNGIDCYAQSVKKLTDAVLQGAESINTHKDGALWSPEEQRMIKELPAADYRRTPLFDKGIPVVEEIFRGDGRERSFLQIEEGRWTEITKRFDYDQVANIVSDYRSLYDGQNPTSREIVKYLINSDERKKLADESFGHADYLITKDLQKDIAPDMPFPEFVDAKSRLKKIAEGLGLAIPTDSAMFRTILKEQVKNPYAYDNELRRIAFQRWPNARDYLEFKGVLTTDTIPLDKLTELFDDYRRESDRHEFTDWIAAGKPPPPPPTAEDPGDTQTDTGSPTDTGSHADSVSGTGNIVPPSSRTNRSPLPPPRRIVTVPPPRTKTPPPPTKKANPPSGNKKPTEWWKTADWGQHPDTYPRSYNGKQSSPNNGAKPPSGKKKPAAGGSTKKSDDGNWADVTYGNKGPLRFYYKPGKK